MTRDLGRQVLPVGRDVHLYFSNPILRRRTPVVPGKLNALEIDQDDASTFTWEKGIKGILFQKREKPYDVEVKNGERIGGNLTIRRRTQGRNPIRVDSRNSRIFLPGTST